MSTNISTIRALNHLMDYHGILFIQDLPRLLTMILDLTQNKDQLTSSFVSSIIQFLDQTSMIQSPEELSLNLDRIMLFLMGEDGIPMKKCQQETKKLLAKLGEKLSFANLDPLVPQKYSRVMRNLRSAHLRQLRRNEASIETPSNSKTTTKVPQSTLTKLMNLSVKGKTKTSHNLETSMGLRSASIRWKLFESFLCKSEPSSLTFGCLL